MIRAKHKQAAAGDIDTYIARFPPDVRRILEKLRMTIRKAAPQAQEKISYQMPTFFLHGNLVHFAAWKTHIGLYPTPSATAKFRKELARYAGAKGSIRLPLDEPMPWGLIRKIVAFRVRENLRKLKDRE